MAQGDFLMMGIRNTAELTTGIAPYGHPPPSAPAFEVYNITHGTGVNVQSIGTALNVHASAPGGDALYVVAMSLQGPSGRGLYVVSDGAEAVRAYSYKDNGVYSYGKINGVMGVSANFNASGVYGENTGAGFGVAGRSTGSGRFGRGAGVWGDHTGRGDGVLGTSATGTGVVGRTSGGVNSAAIFGENASGRADGVGVSALGGSGIGLHASGARAAIRLNPAATTGAPTTGNHDRGELMVDSTGDLFLCKTGGTPGTWVRVA